MKWSKVEERFTAVLEDASKHFASSAMVMGDPSRFAAPIPSTLPVPTINCRPSRLVGKALEWSAGHALVLTRKIKNYPALNHCGAVFSIAHVGGWQSELRQAWICPLTYRYQSMLVQAEWSRDGSFQLVQPIESILAADVFNAFRGSCSHGESFAVEFHKVCVLPFGNVPLALADGEDVCLLPLKALKAGDDPEPVPLKELGWKLTRHMPVKLRISNKPEEAGIIADGAHAAPGGEDDDGEPVPALEDVLDDGRGAESDANDDEGAAAVVQAEIGLDKKNIAKAVQCLSDAKFAETYAKSAHDESGEDVHDIGIMRDLDAVAGTVFSMPAGIADGVGSSGASLKLFQQGIDAGLKGVRVMKARQAITGNNLGENVSLVEYRHQVTV